MKADRVTPARTSTRVVVLVGVAGLILAAAITSIDPGRVVNSMREGIFDEILSSSPRTDVSDSVVIVDIDRDALSAIGPWPWQRDRMADLINRIADAKPSVVAIDILLAPLEDPTAEPADKRLSQALRRIPTALGLVLDPMPNAKLAISTPVATAGEVEVPDLLVTSGVVLPAAELIEHAKGLGVISLPALEGQTVRSVVLLAGGANTLFAGLAAETLRLAEGGGTIIATTTPTQVLRIGARSVPLPSDGLMRLHFTTKAHRQARVLGAKDLLLGKADLSRLAGKIVLVGASAPEAGGLRLTAADPFMPSVEIEADAIEQMLDQHFLRRSGVMKWIEIAAGLALGALGIVSIVLLPPSRAAAVIVGLSFTWIVAAIGLSALALRLTDPATPVIIALFVAQGAGLAQFGATYRQRLAIERRFALHLPPEMVRRIIDNPTEIGFAGETRTITALFTDIEGFTALTEKIAPEALMSLLDRYVDTVAGLIVDHGGMVDKIVGDAVHAFFNAPLDLPQHAGRAVACACAIVEATEALRRETLASPMALGRTRIGIETGQAVLGDVGRGAKRDYTAYGSVVNLASRLEEANKHFGSSILLGPGTVVALAGQTPIRRVGKIAIKGIADEVEVFEPVCPREQSISAP